MSGNAGPAVPKGLLTPPPPIAGDPEQIDVIARAFLGSGDNLTAALNAGGRAHKTITPSWISRAADAFERVWRLAQEHTSTYQKLVHEVAGLMSGFATTLRAEQQSQQRAISQINDLAAEYRRNPSANVIPELQQAQQAAVEAAAVVTRAQRSVAQRIHDLIAQDLPASKSPVAATASTAATAHGKGPTRFGVDTNNATLTPEQAQAHGVTFVARYISQQATAAMTPAEAASWAAAGIDLVAIWEVNTTRATGGGSYAQNYANGVADARAAQAQMIADGGAGQPIYFAVDEKVQDPASVAAYFAGIRSVLGLDRVGAYGSYAVINYLFNNNAITYGWQTATLGSAGQVDPRAQLYQFDVTPPDSMGTSQMDYDRARAANFGQWRSTD